MASIPCRCYDNGQSKPFPIPGLEQNFRFNTEISIWSLDIPDAEENDEIEDQIEEWLIDACEHEDMYYYSEGLVNWKGLARFDWLLKQLGPEHCPIFLQELEHINKAKSTPPAAASQMLKELCSIEQQESVGSAPVLVNSLTGNVVVETIGGVSLNYGYQKNGNSLSLKGDLLTLCISERGFRLENYWSHQEVFRSMAFEILVADKHTEYHALDSQQTFVHYSDPRFSSLFESHVNNKIALHVETRPVLIAWFQETINTFKEALQASIDIDMPIFWHD